MMIRSLPISTAIRSLTIPVTADSLPVLESPTALEIQALTVKSPIMEPPPVPAPSAPLAPTLGLGSVPTLIGIANPSNIGGNVISVPTLDEGIAEGYDQGLPEGSDDTGELTPRSLSMNLGLNMPQLSLNPDIGIPTSPGAPSMSFNPQGGDTVESPIGSAPALTVVAPTAASVKNIIGATPGTETTVTDINRYKSSANTQKMIKYALIAGVVGLVVWYFFFRKGE